MLRNLRRHEQCWQRLAVLWQQSRCLCTDASTAGASTVAASIPNASSFRSGGNDVDCVVIGAGVVGLACARALALQGAEVLVLEQAAAFGTETSSRHSEVIHAGIYYPPGSLKARLCAEGKHLLYQYCADRGIEHKRLGKLIVATDMRQASQLQALQQNAAASGVRDLRLLTASQAREMEPALRCVAAVHSPSTGILDSHGYMQALLADAEGAGASLAVNAEVMGGRLEAQRKVLQVVDKGSGEQTDVSTTYVVNAAGLHAQSVSQHLGLPPTTIPQRHLARGCYFALSGAHAPFTRLIYPLPEQGGLGVHLTLDLGGQARFGPDVEWVNEVSYNVDPQRAEYFYPEVRRYWPGLPSGALVASYAGMRPKLSGAGQPPADFWLQGASGRDGKPESSSIISSSSSKAGAGDVGGGHGMPGLVCLYGIESPGLTASMAIGRCVARMLL